MERTRNGPLPLLVPALVALPLAGLAILISIWRWHDADTRASLTRRIADGAATAERLLDASVQQQSETTRVLATSPVTWLWVKFQGQRLTASNRFHAQAAMEEITSFSGLVPGTTVYLASERTRAVYQSGAAVAALSPRDPRDAWYSACLLSEGVVVSEDPRQVRTSMRVMNGTELIGAVSCVRETPRLAATALSGADDERGFSYILADRSGAIVLSRGPQIGSAATVFDLFDAGEHARLQAAMNVVARPAGMTVDAFASHGRRMLTAVTRTGSPGWYLLVASEIPPMPPARIVALAAIVAAELAVVVAALLLIALSRWRRTGSLVEAMRRQRDDSAASERKAARTAAQVRETAARVRERARALAAETSAGTLAIAETSREVEQAEESAAELRAGITARLSLLAELASSARQATEDLRQAQSGATEVGRAAGDVEEGLNRIITTSTAVSLALENAGTSAGEAAARAERARILALNSALEAARPGSPRRVGAQTAEEMRRLAEGAAESARGLSESLREAREALSAVSRLAQETGGRAHEEAERAVDSARRLQAAAGGIGGTLARLDAANAKAASLAAGAASDRARSAADGVARILERVALLCGEISSLAEEMAAGGDVAEPREPLVPGETGPMSLG